MKRPFNQRTLSLGLAAAFFPQSVLSMPLFEPSGFPGQQWRQASITALRASAVGAVGIGGLQLDISSDLPLNPQNLQYRDGHLQATINEQQYAVKITPLELITAIEVVQNTKQREFEVSIDPTRSGQVPYIDEKLTPLLGFPMLMGDLDFAGVVGGQEPLPVGSPRHPHEEAEVLINSDDKYGELTQRWPHPDFSQINLKAQSRDEK